MVQVGIVRMFVPQRRMMMPVRVRLARRIVGTVHVLMMRVVHMPMGVIYRFVLMFVLVSFGEMQVQPDRHQYTGCDEAQRQRVVEHEDREHRADERRRREIGAGPRRAQIA